MSEIVQYLIFRKDLTLSKGKLAAQAAHASQLGIEAARGTPGWLTLWRANAITKVALVVPDLDALLALGADVEAAGLGCALVTDAGRTEIEPGTITALGLQPMPRDVAAEFVGSLKLL